MKKKLTTTEMIRSYIDAINGLIEQENSVNQLQLIKHYSNNLNSLINMSKEKVESQILNSKYLSKACKEPVSLNQQSTTNQLDDFGKFKNLNKSSNNEIEKTKGNQVKSLKPITTINSYSSTPPVA